MATDFRYYARLNVLFITVPSFDSRLSEDARARRRSTRPPMLAKGVYGYHDVVHNEYLVARVFLHLSVFPASCEGLRQWPTEFSSNSNDPLLMPDSPLPRASLKACREDPTCSFTLDALINESATLIFR